MNTLDREWEEICSINFKDEGYILQKVMNKAGVETYTIVESNNPEDELYSCPLSDLGGMLEHLIDIKRAHSDEE